MLKEVLTAGLGAAAEDSSAPPSGAAASVFSIGAEPVITNPESKAQEAYDRVAAKSWEEVFLDPCTGNWQAHWFLDGTAGHVACGPEGMSLSAGPEFKNDAHHMVLWTKQDFAGAAFRGSAQLGGVLRDDRGGPRDHERAAGAALVCGAPGP